MGLECYTDQTKYKYYCDHEQYNYKIQLSKNPDDIYQAKMSIRIQIYE
jgi:hypothetical protein